MEALLSEGGAQGEPQRQQAPRRNLFVCAEDTAASAAACEWALQNLYCEGDVLHMTYVVKCLLPDMEVFHGVPGTAYSFSPPGEHHEQQLINDAKARLEARFLPLLRPQMVPYQLHLYAEREDTDEGRVAQLILKDIEQRDAAIVILAAHNKPGSLEGVGTVAEYLSTNCHRPLIIVRPPNTGTDSN